MDISEINDYLNDHTDATMNFTSFDHQFTKAYTATVDYRGPDIWDATPPAYDHWNGLKSLIKNFNGTSMEKLAAIETYVHAH